MAARRVLTYALLAVAVFALPSCKLGIDIPNYSIEVQTEKLAYLDGSDIEVNYRFVGENALHRCRYILTNGSGAELERQLTDLMTSGEWHGLRVSVSDEGKYELRLTVLSEESDGELVDMKFLDKSVTFYMDDSAPVDLPEINPKPELSSEAVDVVLTHPDQGNPDASPVTLYYTLDDSPPCDTSNAYSGPFRIEVPAGESGNPVPLRVVAIDSVGFASPVADFTYQFMDIEEVTPDIVVSLGETHVVKDLIGFGFEQIGPPGTPVTVEVCDHDGTSVNTSGVVLSDTNIGITTYPGSLQYDPNSTGFEAGPGWIEVIDTDTGVADKYSILIIP